MVFPFFRTLLVAAVGEAPLLPARAGSAQQAAILLATVTVGTNPEHRVTPAANPMPENNLAMNRHSHCQWSWTATTDHDKLGIIFHGWLASLAC
jgi:hypothetical protein